jgi:hypothetical protein
MRVCATARHQPLVPAQQRPRADREGRPGASRESATQAPSTAAGPHRAAAVAESDGARSPARGAAARSSAPSTSATEIGAPPARTGVERPSKQATRARATSRGWESPTLAIRELSAYKRLTEFSNPRAITNTVLPAESGFFSPRAQPFAGVRPPPLERLRVLVRRRPPERRAVLEPEVADEEAAVAAAAPSPVPARRDARFEPAR